MGRNIGVNHTLVGALFHQKQLHGAKSPIWKPVPTGKFGPQRDFPSPADLQRARGAHGNPQNPFLLGFIEIH